LRLTTGEVRFGSVHAILDEHLAILTGGDIDSFRYDLIKALDRHRDREAFKAGLLTGVAAGILAGLAAYLTYRSGSTDLTRAQLAGRVASYGALGGFALGTVVGVARSPWVRIYP